jgi:hypothetical protein
MEIELRPVSSLDRDQVTVEDYGKMKVPDPIFDSYVLQIWDELNHLNSRCIEPNIGVSVDLQKNVIVKISFSIADPHYRRCEYSRFFHRDEAGVCTLKHLVRDAIRSVNNYVLTDQTEAFIEVLKKEQTL